LSYRGKSVGGPPRSALRNHSKGCAQF